MSTWMVYILFCCCSILAAINSQKLVQLAIAICYMRYGVSQWTHTARIEYSADGIHRFLLFLVYVANGSCMIRLHTQIQNNSLNISALRADAAYARSVCIRMTSRVCSHFLVIQTDYMRKMCEMSSWFFFLVPDWIDMRYTFFCYCIAMQSTK